MVYSVNTNAGSLGGLRSFQAAHTALGKSQNEISTGLKIASPKDNAAILAIAQKLTGDLGGLNAVKGSLDRAISTTDVALAAGENVSNLLLSLKETAVKAADPGLDDASREALSQQFKSIRDQIGTTVASASFNGANLLSADGKAAQAITSADGSQQISVDAQDLSLGGDNIAVCANQCIDDQSTAALTALAIDQSIGRVSSALSKIGAGAQGFERAKEFSEKLEGVTKAGIGNLVDADLGSTAAKHAANQVKESLSLTALSIANQQPKTVLQLFG